MIQKFPFILYIPVFSISTSSKEKNDLSRTNVCLRFFKGTLKKTHITTQTWTNKNAAPPLRIIKLHSQKVREACWTKGNSINFYWESAAINYFLRKFVRHNGKHNGKILKRPLLSWAGFVSRLKERKTDCPLFTISSISVTEMAFFCHLNRWSKNTILHRSIIQ